MNCPKCRSRSLRRLRSAARAKTSPPVKCHKCNGVWVHVQEVPQILADHDLAQTLDSSATATSEAADKQAGLCPDGHGILSRTRIDIGDGFYLDRCTTCSGVWFDAGEWHRVSEHHLLANLNELWTASWQREQRDAAQAHAHETWARSTFGDALYERLLKLADELKDHPFRSSAFALLAEKSRGPEPRHQKVPGSSC